MSRDTGWHWSGFENSQEECITTLLCLPSFCSSTHLSELNVIIVMKLKSKVFVEPDQVVREATSL
jgi:hypothetical protein